MSQASALRDLDMRIHAAFASAGFAFSDAVYTAPAAPPVSPVRGYLDLGAQVLGEFGQVVDRRDEIKFLRADVQAPVRLAHIDVDGIRYVLDAKVTDDESNSIWVVRRVGVTP